jgi:hypothetical protein
MNRVFPNGRCWCGCGESTERTVFFVPGHDKRAEARVVKEVYGSVPDFLTAHGYGPEGRDPQAAIREGIDATGLQLLEAWSREGRGMMHRVHVVLEVLDGDNRTGPLIREQTFHVEHSPSDRAFHFDGCSDRHQEKFTAAYPDIGWVYVDRLANRVDQRIVRLRGALVGQGEQLRFKPFG